MSHAVIKVSADQIAKMKLHFTSYLQRKLPQEVCLRLKLGCSLTAYRSGKVLFQGKEAETEAAKWEAL